MNNKIKLSIVLAVYNEEKNIKPCLTSIKEIAEEIIVIDGSSIDNTRKIAAGMGADVYKVSNKLMFHKNKQIGLEKAKGDWILQLDADERVTKKLAEEIIKALDSKNNGFYLPRKNYFLGKWLKKGGQYPDYVIRLVRKNKAYFPCQTVHEQIAVKGETGHLKNPLIHLSNPTLAEYFRKARIYTSETALRLKKEPGSKIQTAASYLLLKPIITFFSLFIRHKGFLDGFHGFLFAFLSALHFPWAYLKGLSLQGIIPARDYPFGRKRR